MPLSEDPCREPAASRFIIFLLLRNKPAGHFVSLQIMYINYKIMKTSSFRRFLPAAVAFIALMSVSSCNRGVGCPSNFSLQEVVTTVVDWTLAAIF